MWGIDKFYDHLIGKKKQTRESSEKVVFAEIALGVIRF